MQQTTDLPSQDRLAEAIQNLANAIERSGGAGTPATADVDAGGAGIDMPTDLDGFQAWLSSAQDKFLDFLPSLIGAVVILILGWFVAKMITALVKKALGKSKLDATLISFLSSMLYMVLMVFVIISAITKLGVNTTSFVAILGAAGFAVGFAMQGSLSNFAAGVMLMIFRPVRAGDLVEAGGVLGIIQEIGVFATVINTLENKKAIVANSTITGGNIINYTANGMLRVDMTFGIGYDDDIGKAMGILQELLDKDERVLRDPAPAIAVAGHGASSVDIICRPTTSVADYWGVWFDMHRAVKEAYDAAGISIPYPQQDVHMHQVS